MNSKKKGMTLATKQRAAGWTFLAPATIMIAIMSFYPMIRAFIISLQTGAGANMRFADPIFSNYKRILADKVFQQSIVNTFLYLIIQVPIMLILAILLAQLLNNKDLKFKGFFRTCVFPAMCNIPGILFIDLPFHVCYRWSDQQYSDQTWDLIYRL